MTYISKILTLLRHDERSFQTYSAPVAATYNNARNQERTDSFFQTEEMHMLQTAIFMTSAVIHEAAQSVVRQVLMKKQVLNDFSLKKQHSQHARQRTPMEEGFTSLTRITANVLFHALVPLTVQRQIRIVQQDNMPT